MATNTSEQYCLRWNNHQQNLQETMAEQWENQIFTDVTLGVEYGRTIQCHKMILAASSHYFHNLFDTFSSEHHIVILDNVDFNYMLALVEYMYKGEINVAGEDLAGLFEVAEGLEVKGLISERKDKGSSSPRLQISSRVFPIESAPEIFKNGGGVAGEERSSSSHSTSSPYYSNGKLPASGDSKIVKQPISPPVWPFAQAFPVDVHDPIAAAAALQSSLSARYSSLVGTSVDNGAEVVPRRRRRRKMSNNNVVANRSAPILHTALNQGQVENSQAIPMLHHLHRQDSSHCRSPSNGSANNESHADNNKQSSVDHFNSSLPMQSPYESETSMVDDNDKIARRSFSEDPNGGHGQYGPGQKQGTAKRYKQYTHADIARAIAAVLESGMSANKAAVLFRVPSRTLYDKISRVKKEEELKNGGCTLQPKRRRSAVTSSACFPFGIGGNATGSIYGHYSGSDNENGALQIDNPASVLETTFTESQDHAIDRDIKPEILMKGPSPPRLPVRSPTIDRHEETEIEAEDLSVRRKSEDFTIDRKPENLTVGRKFEDLTVGCKSEDLTISRKPENLSVGRKSKVPVKISASIAIKEAI